MSPRLALGLSLAAAFAIVVCIDCTLIVMRFEQDFGRPPRVKKFLMYFEIAAILLTGAAVAAWMADCRIVFGFDS